MLLIAQPESVIAYTAYIAGLNVAFNIVRGCLLNPSIARVFMCCI